MRAEDTGPLMSGKKHLLDLNFSVSVCCIWVITQESAVEDLEIPKGVPLVFRLDRRTAKVQTLCGAWLF